MAYSIAKVLAAAACVTIVAAFGTGEIKSTITEVSPTRGSAQVCRFAVLNVLVAFQLFRYTRKPCQAHASMKTFHTRLLLYRAGHG